MLLQFESKLFISLENSWFVTLHMYKKITLFHFLNYIWKLVGRKTIIYWYDMWQTFVFLRVWFVGRAIYLLVTLMNLLLVPTNTWTTQRVPFPCCYRWRWCGRSSTWPCPRSWCCCLCTRVPQRPVSSCTCVCDGHYRQGRDLWVAAHMCVMVIIGTDETCE